MPDYSANVDGNDAERSRVWQERQYAMAVLTAFTLGDRESVKVLLRDLDAARLTAILLLASAMARGVAELSDMTIEEWLPFVALRVAAPA